MSRMTNEMEQREAEGALSIFRNLTFDAGLVIRDARVARSSEGPVLLVWFEDRRPSSVEPLAAWWDFAVAGTSGPDPEFKAGLAKAYLEEVFQAGGPLDERPRDGNGIRWAEMDWDGERGHRLPPVTPLDAP
jgi:hypothetical protein